MTLRPNRDASAKRVRELIDLAFANRYMDVATMLRLSSKAVLIVEERCAEVPIDLKAAAWTQYGNALRITGRYPEAERALDRAAAFPVTDLPTRVHCLEITSSLYRSTGRYEKAERLLKSAIEAYRLQGDSDGQARTYNLLGIVYFDRGNLAQALRAYKISLDLLGPEVEVEFFASATINFVEALIADGRLSAATSALARLQHLYHSLTSSRLRAKAEWKQAQLCRALKQFKAARSAYTRAYELLSIEPVPELAELARELDEFAALTKRED